MAARFTFVEISDGTGITSQVKLDALFLQSPTGGPESTVTHVVQVMTLAPWILDHATQRRDNNESEEHCCSAQKSLHGLTTSKRGSLPGVIQQSSKRTTINLIRRSIMTTLYRNFLRHELLHELNNCDTKTNNRNAGGQAKQWSVEVVPNQAFFAMNLEFPWPEDVDAEESQSTNNRDDQPNVDSAGCSLLCRVTSYWKAFFAERNGDIVQLSTQSRKLFVAHALEFVIGVFLIYIAHERDPIHIAAAHKAVMPIIHIAKPSATGPRPPRPQPAGEGVSLADLM